jgi:hypothetical protein
METFKITDLDQVEYTVTIEQYYDTVNHWLDNEYPDPQGVESVNADTYWDIVDDYCNKNPEEVQP